MTVPSVIITITISIRFDVVSFSSEAAHDRRSLLQSLFSWFATSAVLLSLGRHLLHFTSDKSAER